MTGTTRIISSASFQLRSSMATKTPSTYPKAQSISKKFQATMAAIRLVSLITRERI